jgi:photosystem II stability/assembly factor-like uncharacterized protein
MQDAMLVAAVRLSCNIKSFVALYVSAAAATDAESLAAACHEVAMAPSGSHAFICSDSASVNTKSASANTNAQKSRMARRCSTACIPQKKRKSV